MNQQHIKFLKSLSTGLVLVAVAVAFLIAGVRLFGLQVFGVLTGSMEPSYPVGSLIYVKSVDTDDLRVNDVITFNMSSGTVATHRIVELVPDQNNPSMVRFRTKGDANREVDASLVSPGSVVGKVLFVVPYLGHLASYIQSPPGLYVAIAICGLMIAFVFYTDSLENKSKQANPQKSKLTEWINHLSMKVLGKPLIQPKGNGMQQGNAAPGAMGYPQGQMPPQMVQGVGAQQVNSMQPGNAAPGGVGYLHGQMPTCGPQQPTMQGYGRQPAQSYYPQQPMQQQGQAYPPQQMQPARTYGAQQPYGKQQPFYNGQSMPQRYSQPVPRQPMRQQQSVPYQQTIQQGAPQQRYGQYPNLQGHQSAQSQPCPQQPGQLTYSQQAQQPYGNPPQQNQPQRRTRRAQYGEQGQFGQ